MTASSCADDVPSISDDCREEVYQYKISRNANINKNIPLGEHTSLSVLSVPFAIGWLVVESATILLVHRWALCLWVCHPPVSQSTLCLPQAACSCG